MALNAWLRVAVQQSCSRADAERYIEGGWIAVDGQVVEEPGFRVGASQTVSLPGARLETLRPVTILVHKPVGVCQRRTASARDLIVPANRMEGDRRRSATSSACWPDCDW